MLRGTLTAAVVAAILLVAVVLPAEYGIDPTGIGKGLGLDRPPSAVPASAAPPASAPPGMASGNANHLVKSPIPFRTDEMSLVLQPLEGAEIKAVMSQGGRLVFGWTSTGIVDVDMHGEKTGAAKGEYTTYWKDSEQDSGHGALEAPFAGTHGWYWENLGTEPVTVKVKTSGFYEALMQP